MTDAAKGKAIDRLAAQKSNRRKEGRKKPKEKKPKKLDGTLAHRCLLVIHDDRTPPRPWQMLRKTRPFVPLQHSRHTSKCEGNEKAR